MKIILTEMINEELMPIALNPKRWWNVYVSEDEKKEIEPILPFHVYIMDVLKHFSTKT